MGPNFLRTRIFADATSRSERSEKQTCYGRWRSDWHDAIHRSMKDGLENHLPIFKREARSTWSMSKDVQHYRSKVAQGNADDQMFLHRFSRLAEQELTTLRTQNLRKWEAK